MGCSMKRQWLLSISGARADVLAQCESERVKFESLGWAILITSGLAMVSMWFALYSAMGVNPFAAVIPALAWGLVIMGIDRWLITSMPAEGRRRFSMAVPRLLLALLLGTLISTPLVLRIFQSEVNAQISVIKAQRASQFLQSQQRSQVGEQVTYWRNDVNRLQQVIDTGGQATTISATDPEIKELTAQRTDEIDLQQKYYREWQCQLYGGPGCPAGNGQLSQASEQSYQQATQQINTIDNKILQRETQLSQQGAAAQKARLDQANVALPGAQNQLKLALARQNELQESFDAANEATNGLLIRLEALSQLSDNNFTVASARFLLFLLFLVIECLPVIVKLLQQPGNYEKILQIKRDRELSEAKRAYRGRQAGATSPASSGTSRAAGTMWGAVTGLDEDILRIWQDRSEERTKVPPPGDHTSTESIGHQAHTEQNASVQPSSLSDTGEQPAVADRELREMQDQRIPATSDGHAGGIPLRWDDDD